MSKYWQDRLAQAQLMLSRKKEKEIEKQYNSLIIPGWDLDLD